MTTVISKALKTSNTVLSKLTVLPSKLPLPQNKINIMIIDAMKLMPLDTAIDQLVAKAVMAAAFIERPSCSTEMLSTETESKDRRTEQPPRLPRAASRPSQQQRTFSAHWEWVSHVSKPKFALPVEAWAPEAVTKPALL